MKHFSFITRSYKYQHFFNSKKRDNNQIIKKDLYEKEKDKKLKYYK
jgi:hypothetical protein